MTDRIEKKVVLRAPRDRVWNAIADAKQFGTWFGVELDGSFVAGTKLNARIRPTKVDAETAKTQQKFDGMAFAITVERVDAMRELAFRWHPFAIEPNVDYSSEPTTLVQFVLDEVAGGTQLTITESGFDRLPPERRAKAFEANDSGWQKQTELLAKYLTL